MVKQKKVSSISLESTSSIEPFLCSPRLLSKSERQRTSAEAELRTVSAKLEEAGGRLAETSLRREGLEGTARRLEEELGKEQQRAAEARQSHERERNTLNQV